MVDRGPEPVLAEAVALRRDDVADRTQERNRSSVIDALRALAALMVLAAHASFIADGGHPGPAGTAVRQMLGAGVLLFFSISGYLIAGPFLSALVQGRPMPSLRAYLLRRAARIYPAYWLALAGALVLLWPPGGVRAYQWPVHLLLLQSSWPVAGEPTSMFFVAWTLGVEAAFYAFVPLAAWALRAIHPGPWSPARLASLVLAAGAVSAGWVYVDQSAFGGDASTLALLGRIGLQSWLYAFCPGMIVALAALAGPQSWRWWRALMARPAVVLAAAGVLWGLAYAMERAAAPILVINYQVPFVLASGLVLGCVVVAGSWITPVARILAPVGLISYGIYLWHDTIVNLLWQHSSIGFRGGAGAWAGDILIVIAITVPLAAASWFAVERPAMRRAAAWARRRSDPSPLRAPAPAPAEGG
jgi:peptidoglycan/LPS O-acetylase OafA/YrhL